MLLQKRTTNHHRKHAPGQSCSMPKVRQSFIPEIYRAYNLEIINFANEITSLQLVHVKTMSQGCLPET